MKNQLIVSLLVSSAFGAPTSPWPLFSSVTGISDAAGFILAEAQQATLQQAIKPGKESPTSYWKDEDGRSFVTQNGIEYEQIGHPAFADHSLRVTSPNLCDSVKQYSGYLDIAQEKHLFFWFFESRNSPSEDPLVLWLNGGPGCSSSTGLLFELGPCSVTEGGHNIKPNPNSWNTHANVSHFNQPGDVFLDISRSTQIIFLDQPINVGFSYSSDPSTVNNSPVAALDVWTFLELFITRYPEYSHLPFHIAAESYGGTYAPNIASVIHKKNKELSFAAMPNLKTIPLESVILANGHTDPYIQMASIPKFACESPFAVYDDPNGPECRSLRAKASICQRLIKSCYDFDSRFTCVPATLYCDSQLYGPFQQLNLNPYDVRRKCNRAADKDGPFCYKQMSWVDVWMNKPEVKKELGANPERKFESVNLEVNQAFTLRGDGMHNSAALLPELLEHGVRLLVYAGNADLMCNYMGNLDWMLALPSKFQTEFVNSSALPWITLETGRVAGEVRIAGGSGMTAGNYIYVYVHNAGHMVPYDQPEAALDLFVRWISHIPLSLDHDD